MLRIAAVTSMPSALSSGLSMISMGNSLPSLRSADQLDAGADLLGQRVFGGAQVVGDQPLGEAFRNDVGDLLAEQLVAAVAELLLRLHVEQHDLAGLVHHHHRVRRRLQQAAVAALHLRQMLFGRLAHADVADRRRDQHALGAFQRAEHDLDGELAAVLAQRDQLDAGADLLGQRVLGGAQVVGDQPLGEAFRDDVRDLLAEQFVAAVAELLLRLHVQQHDLCRPGSPPPWRPAPPPAGRDISRRLRCSR